MPRKHTLLVRPFNNRMFPHDDFPPFDAIVDLTAIVIDAAERLPKRSSLDRMLVPLTAAAERIIAVAGGGLPVEKWWRRVDTAMRMLDRARSELDAYVAAGALVDADAAAIAAALARAMRLLVDAASEMVPDDVLCGLPPLTAAPPAVH